MEYIVKNGTTELKKINARDIIDAENQVKLDLIGNGAQILNVTYKDPHSTIESTIGTFEIKQIS